MTNENPAGPAGSGPTDPAPKPSPEALYLSPPTAGAHPTARFTPRGPVWSLRTLAAASVLSVALAAGGGVALAAASDSSGQGGPGVGPGGQRMPGGGTGTLPGGGTGTLPGGGAGTFPRGGTGLLPDWHGPTGAPPAVPQQDSLAGTPAREGVGQDT